MKARDLRLRAEELLTMADDMRASEPGAMIRRLAEDYLARASGEARRCSQCGGEIGPDESPLAVWCSEGWSLLVCDGCGG